MTNYNKIKDNGKSIEMVGKLCDFVTFQNQTFAMFQLLSDESAGKVVKAASKCLTGDEEPDLASFAEAEKVCYRFLLHDTIQRRDGYLEACKKKSEKAKEREANKKQQLESRTLQNSGFEKQNSAELCTIQDNTLQSLQSLQSVQSIQDNTKQSSSSSSLARTREDDEEEDTVNVWDNKNSKLSASALEVLETPIQDRKNAFWTEVFSPENEKKYGSETLNQFYAFYSDLVHESGLMLFEDLKYNPKPNRRGTFDVTRRLMNWKKDNK